MEIRPHLDFPGTCEEAFRFYQRCFGGEIVTLQKWGETPLATLVEPEWFGKVCHATLKVGEAELLGVDPPPGQYQPLAGMQLSVQIEDEEEMILAFRSLSEEGTVLLPLQETHWAKSYGIVIDRFGVKWELQSPRP